MTLTVPHAASPMRFTLERNERFYPTELHSVCGERRVTFAEFGTRVRRLASSVERLGMRHQDRIAILAMNCGEYVEVYGVAEMTGFIINPVNWRLAAPEVAYILQNSAPRVLVFEAQYASMVESMRAVLPSIEHYICLGDDPPGWALRYEDVLAAGDPAGAKAVAAADDVLCLMYTSGTTGRPKGCMLTHANQNFTATQSCSDQGILPGDKALVIAPLFHLGARAQHMQVHHRGGCAVILRSFTPELALRSIAEERIQHAHMVPIMVQAVLDLPGGDRWDTSSLKCLVYAAAPMPVPVLRRAIERFGRIMINAWGQTECGNGTVFPAFLHRPNGTPKEVRRLASVGQPNLGNELRVVDEHDQEVPCGQIGELCVRSAGVMRGYWNSHAATIETLRDGWLHTGDMGYVDDEGFVFLVDRKKDMIVSGGENVYCREVEEAIHEFKGVLEAAVIGVPDPKWGEAVKAVVVRSPGAAFTANELVAHCRQHIAGFKCPKVVEFVEALPRLPSGKVSKVVLREQSRTP